MKIFAERWNALLCIKKKRIFNKPISEKFLQVYNTYHGLLRLLYLFWITSVSLRVAQSELAFESFFPRSSMC